MIDQVKQDQYLGSIQPILEPLVQKILQFKPDDVVEFMLNYLENYKLVAQANAITENQNDEDQDDKNSKKSFSSSDEEQSINISPYNKKRRNCLIPTPFCSVELTILLEKQEQIDFIINFMKDCFVFSNFTTKQQTNLAKNFEIITLTEYQSLYNYQQPVHGLYIVFSGSLLIFTEEEKFLKEIRAGDEFGLNSLLHLFPSPFHLWAGENTVLLHLQSQQFNVINQQVMKDVRMKQYESLREISLFKQLNDEQIHLLIDNIERVYIQRNEFIFYQGDEGDGMYVIEEGYCIALIDNREVYKFKTSDYFGELALIEKGKRKTSILCKTNCVLMKISAQTFNSLFSSLVMNQVYD